MRRVLTVPSCVVSVVVVLIVIGLLPLALAQNAPSATAAAHLENQGQHQPATEPRGTAIQATANSEEASPSLLLGPGDELEVSVYGAPDLSGRARIGETGNISMPLIGYVHVAGLSTTEAETVVEAQLRQNNILNNPQVSIYAKDFTNSGISVAGEVAKPGFYSVLGPHRLFDVLQLAGGTTDRASNVVTISHRDQEDPTTVTLSKNSVEMAIKNIYLKPGDTVVVPRAGIVYVLGEVTRPGGYVLNATGGVTVVQVVAVAGGPTHLAAYGKATILHRTPTGFQEQKIDLKKLLRGKREDIALVDSDIVFVPTSGMKSAMNVTTLVAAAGTTAIYRVPF